MSWHSTLVEERGREGRERTYIPQKLEQLIFAGTSNRRARVHLGKSTQKMLHEQFCETIISFLVFDCAEARTSVVEGSSSTSEEPGKNMHTKSVRIDMGAGSMNALHACSSIAEDSSIDSLIYDIPCERDLFYGRLAWSESLSRSETIRGGGWVFENG